METPPQGIYWLLNLPTYKKGKYGKLLAKLAEEMQQRKPLVHLIYQMNMKNYYAILKRAKKDL